MKYPPYFWLALHRTKLRGRFCKIMWPSQNGWTLLADHRTFWPPVLNLFLPEIHYPTLCILMSWLQDMFVGAVCSGDGLTQSIQENKVGFIFENRTIYQVRSKALVLLRWTFPDPFWYDVKSIKYHFSIIKSFWKFDKWSPILNCSVPSPYCQFGWGVFKSWRQN